MWILASMSLFITAYKRQEGYMCDLAIVASICAFWLAFNIPVKK